MQFVCWYYRDPLPKRRELVACARPTPLPKSEHEIGACCCPACASRLRVFSYRSSGTTGSAASAPSVGKPKGELKQLARMEASWSKLPNTLIEDETGQLFFAFTDERLGDAIEPDGGFEAVDVETALDWLQHVSDFVDGWDGDVADVCRLALREIRSRPTDMDRIKAAVAEDRKAGWKPRPRPAR